MGKTLEQKARDKDPLVRCSAAMDENAPLELLELLSNDSDSLVRADVASNERSSEQILRKLSKDDDETVRCGIASNPLTPIDILEILSNDKSKYVKQNVKFNPKSKAIKSSAPGKDTGLDKKTQIIQSINSILSKIIDDNLNEFKKTKSLKVRPGYGYDKFYLDTVDGSYDESLHGLIHYILFEEGYYEKFLTKSQMKDVQAVVSEFPESIYRPESETKQGLRAQEILDDIYWDCITHVAKYLKSKNLLVDVFVDYL